MFTTGRLPSGTGPVYPQHASLWFDEFNTIGGTSPGVNIDTGSPYNIYVLTTGDQTQYTTNFLLAAGSYTFSVLGDTTAPSGKIDWYIDDILVVSQQDWYSASTVRVVLKTATVTVLTNGLHVLRGKTNGHNASSSGFNLQIQKCWLKPAIDAF